MDLNALNVVTTAVGPEDPIKKLGSLPSAPSKYLVDLSKKIIGKDEEPEEPKIGIKDSRGIKSGQFSKKHIEGIIKASKEVGIDPTRALALAWQESGFAHKTGKKGRRGGAIIEDLAQILDFEPAQEKEVNEKAASTGIDPQYLKLAVVLRDKMKYGKQLGFNDEAAQLQAYNGYGTLTPKQFGGATKAYGVDISQGVSMKKNPLYGKRLLELAADISKNKEVSDMINSVGAQVKSEKMKKTAEQVYKNSIAIK